MQIDAAASLPLTLPAAAEAALRACSQSWHDAAVAEGHLHTALTAAPQSLAVRIGAYKFYFYRNRLGEAAAQALACLGLAAETLGLAADWRLVRPDQAPFWDLLPQPRLYLQSLLAYGYCRVRLGDADEGRAALVKVAELDPADRFGAARLVAVVDRGGVDPEDEEDEAPRGPR